MMLTSDDIDDAYWLTMYVVGLSPDLADVSLVFCDFRFPGSIEAVKCVLTQTAMAASGALEEF